jgi:hypothetical protein
VPHSGHLLFALCLALPYSRGFCDPGATLNWAGTHIFGGEVRAPARFELAQVLALKLPAWGAFFALCVCVCVCVCVEFGVVRAIFIKPFPASQPLYVST